MDTEKMLEQYYQKFGKLPPLTMVLTWRNPEYKKDIEEAIKNNKEIKMNDLAKYCEK